LSGFLDSAYKQAYSIILLYFSFATFLFLKRKVEKKKAKADTPPAP